MQPYFIPYAGYFRLFAMVDVFVIYDCVQFPQRGWVHRNRLPDTNEKEQWLSLPLQKKPRSTLIKDLIFAEDIQERLPKLFNKFPVIKSLCSESSPLSMALQDVSITPLNYIEKLLAISCNMLDLPFCTIRSSELGIPSHLKGKDRIIAISRKLNASHYINASGGRQLYNIADFRHFGIKLSFFDDYHGAYTSILYRLLTEKRNLIKSEIIKNTHY